MISKNFQVSYLYSGTRSPSAPTSLLIFSACELLYFYLFIYSSFFINGGAYLDYYFSVLLKKRKKKKVLKDPHRKGKTQSLPTLHFTLSLDLAYAQSLREKLLLKRESFQYLHRHYVCIVVSSTPSLGTILSSPPPVTPELPGSS